jgi:hypothetical protein
MPTMLNMTEGSINLKGQDNKKGGQQFCRISQLYDNIEFP